MLAGRRAEWAGTDAGSSDAFFARYCEPVARFWPGLGAAALGRLGASDCVRGCIDRGGDCHICGKSVVSGHGCRVDRVGRLDVGAWLLGLGIDLAKARLASALGRG